MLTGIRRGVVVLAVAVVVVLTTGQLAQGAVIRIDDPNRDGQKGASLDITAVRVANNPRAIRIRLAFRRVVPGDLAIYYRPVGAPARDIIGVVSEHRRRGDRNFVITQDGRQRCSGLRVTWSSRRDTAHVRLPAACLRDGDYRRIRVRMITEIGSDADLAPGTRDGGWPWSRPVARG